MQTGTMKIPCRAFLEKPTGTMIHAAISPAQPGSTPASIDTSVKTKCESDFGRDHVLMKLCAQVKALFLVPVHNCSPQCQDIGLARAPVWLTRLGKLHIGCIEYK